MVMFDLEVGGSPLFCAGTHIENNRSLHSVCRPPRKACQVSDPAETVRALVEETAKGLGYELVRVTFGGGRKPTLQIMAERADGTMGVDDCAKLSRELSVILDVEDPIAGEYLLEVSSPGIDRPLTRAKDFSRWIGFEAKVEMTDQLMDGRRRFRGTLTAFEDDTIHMDTEDGPMALPFDGVSKAKLMMTDALLEATQGKAASDASEGSE